MAYVLGVDYGTNSVRALVVDCATGKELGSSVFAYPTGKEGIILDPRDPNVARQNPADYLLGMEKAVKGALAQAKKTRGFSPDKVLAIGVDTTGSTPIPVDRSNNALSAQKRFAKNPAAQAWLWKDHTGAEEAARITELAQKHRPDYLAKCGGTYSSEWFWSKIWHCQSSAGQVFDAAYSWIECADWIPSQLAGVTDPREIVAGICPAGHKALYSAQWGGYPDTDFLAKLSPQIAALRERLPQRVADASVPAGTLCAKWAATLGLPQGIAIAVGAFDAHTGAVGAGVTPGVLVKVIGTSTCDLAVAPLKKALPDIAGICGIVPGSILPGHYGIEAGQSAVGDIFKWFVETVCQGDAAHHTELTRQAEALTPGESGLLALDWNNGNRTILVDPRLTGLLVGQTLATTRAHIYRTLIEATAFGARTIIERMREYGVTIKGIICTGGIAEKNVLLMQIYADICKCELMVSRSSQTCALGSAVLASTLVPKKNGGHATVQEAQKKMCGVRPVRYSPDKEATKTYDKLYRLYRTLHDSFGGVTSNLPMGSLMKELIAIRQSATGKARPLIRRRGTGKV